MKPDPLDQLLKSATVPERPGAYWQEFPNRIAAALRRQPAARVDGRASRRAFPGLAVIGLACGCLAVGIFLTVRETRRSATPSVPLADARKYFDEIEALFPHQVRAIVFDRQGAHLVLADHADVPPSAPLYLQVHTDGGSEDIVTFSGQEIPFQGENCEVLADAQGQVIVMGSRLHWPQPESRDHLTVSAQLLERSPSL